MPNENSPGKHPLTANAEFLLKLGTTILGLLYVFGLLVSNVQLMELGISDFTSLQARNIMTGFLFFLYVALLLLILAPISAAISICGRTMTSSARTLPGKTARCIRTVVNCLLLSIFFAVAFGSLFGSIMYPWGRPWDVWFHSAWTWQFLKSDLQTIYAQLADTFWNLKIIVGSVLLIVASSQEMEIVLTKIDPSLLPIDRVISRDPPFSFTSLSDSLLTLIGALIAVSPFLLAGFAYEVYPNVKYNLGGGQPIVAELQIGTDKSAVTKLPGIGVCCATTRPEDTASTDPVVIWYQSDKFLYLSPLSTLDQGPARLIAFDISMVRTIHYLPMSVRVGSGGRVLSVHSD